MEAAKVVEREGPTQANQNEIIGVDRASPKVVILLVRFRIRLIIIISLPWMLSRECRVNILPDGNELGIDRGTSVFGY